MVSSAVCLIVKNEVENIAEWVAHNAILGFDRIVVYDNRSDDGTSELLAALSRNFPLSVWDWDDDKAQLSSCKQMAAYQHCLDHDGATVDWLAYLDADEFLIPPAGSSLSDLLERNDDANGIAFNWRIFGSSGLNTTRGRLVMEAFDRRAVLGYNINRHVKMMFRPSKAIRLVNPHYVEVENGTVDVEGRPMQWSEPGITVPDGIVAGDWKLHHYIIRSRTHWERRIARRQTDGMIRGWEEFDEYDRNEVVDANAFPPAHEVRALLQSQGFSYAEVPSLGEHDDAGRQQRSLPHPVEDAPLRSNSAIMLVLDEVDGDQVHGWAHDPAGDLPVVLRPLIDGRPFAEIRCDLARPDVLNSAIAKEFVGFGFAVAPELLDGGEHVLTFEEPDGRPVDFITHGRQVSHYPFRGEFKPVLFSSLDGMQSSILRGWVACRRAPGAALDTSCTLLVTANDVEIATLRADRPRPDVAAQLGCTADCGFALPLPAAYRTATVQEFRVFLMPERRELTGSPLVTSFVQHDHAMKLTGLLEYMEGISHQIESLQAVVRSIIPSQGLTLDSYDTWQRQTTLGLRRWMRDTAHVRKQTGQPLVSIVCPVYRPELVDFQAAIRSVIDQTYENWELILVNDGSDRADLDRMIDGFVQADRRILLVGDGRNHGISGATNQALKAVHGEWIAFFDHDDLLVDVALETMIAAAQATGARLLYSDEDKVDEFGFFSEPAFKPDWNYRYLLSVNYINHLTIARADLVAQAGGCLRHALDGAQDHDFLLRLVERLRPSEIHHVPEVLYHWRKAAQSTALSGAVKAYAVEAGVRAVSDHLRRIGRPAEVASRSGQTSYTIRWLSDATPKVSVIIPFKDKIAMTLRCLDHLLTHTPYPAFDIILVDNGSVEPATLSGLREASRDPRVSVLRIDEEFNYARLNNLAAAASDAELFVFMNNDLFVQDEHWLPLLMGEVLADPSVAATGGKFLFENRTIQHSGVVLGLGGVAGHVFVGEPETCPGYGSRALLAHDVSAVTAACVLVRADVFRQIGGFDEVNLKVAFNDIDLCLRIGEAGYRIVMVPDFVAEHHESISRGAEDKPEKVARFKRESDYMKERWGDALLSDPHYNSNFSLEGRPFHDLARRAR